MLKNPTAFFALVGSLTVFFETLMETINSMLLFCITPFAWLRTLFVPAQLFSSIAHSNTSIRVNCWKLLTLEANEFSTERTNECCNIKRFT